MPDSLASAETSTEMSGRERHGAKFSPRSSRRHIRRLPYIADGRATDVSRRPAPSSVPSWPDPGVDDAEYGVIVLGRDGVLKHASDLAYRWLREYFDARPQRPGSLPKPLWKWLRGHRRLGADDRGQPGAPALSVSREGRHLIVRLIPGRAWSFLVLEESTPALGPEIPTSFRLTARESEVLAWVAVGKANQDIAAALDISPRTVKKHLEHIYDKLGVETRTAAATFFALPSSVHPARRPEDVADRPTRVECRIDEGAPAENARVEWRGRNRTANDVSTVASGSGGIGGTRP